MEEIKRQVARARFRLVVQQFLTIATWSLFAALLIAVVGVAIPKIWALAPTSTDQGSQIWHISWIAGSVVAGLITAIVATYLVRRGELEAAIEIDRRFGLKERVSSTLALDEESQSTEIGEALVADAEHRVRRIDVRERFSVGFSWRNLLPILPAVALAILMLLVADVRLAPKKVEAKETPVEDKEQVIEAQKQLKKKIQQQRKKAEELGLKDAEELLKQIEKAVQDIDKKAQGDRKKTMVQLNDLKKKIEEQRKKSGGAEDLKKQLQQLGKPQQGPADKMANAMRRGDFGKAMKALKELQKKVENGELDKEEAKKQLQKQMEQMQKKMQEMADANKKAMENLQKQIDDAKKAGDKQKQQQLQKQMDQMQQQQQQAQQMQKLAQQMGEVAKAMKAGDKAAAAQQLQQMAQQMQQMQQQMDELEMMDEMLDQLADAKNAMNCKQCNGAGCKACQGMGGFQFGQGQGQKPGNGLGEGRGQGDRPEEETPYSAIDSQVRAKPKAGESVRVGDAGGPNIAGISTEQAKEAVRASIDADADPITSQKLPRWQQEHAKEFFKNLREGTE